MRVELIALRSRPIGRGEDLVEAFVSAAREAGVPLLDGDIVAISAKVVSTSMGAVRRLSDVSPSSAAASLSAETSLDPRFVELILRESDAVLGACRGSLLTLKGSQLVPNAGADLKNSLEGFASLWPRDPDLVAWRIMMGIRGATGRRVGVLIVDSGLRPLRRGTSGVAVGSAGFNPVRSYVGLRDLYGRVITMTSHNLEDDLASAAHLLMGEGAEGTPFVVIRGAPVEITDGLPAGRSITPSRCFLVGPLIFRGDPGG